MFAGFFAHTRLNWAVLLKTSSIFGVCFTLTFPAHAQQDVCSKIKAELAALSSQNYSQSDTSGLRNELNRVRFSMQSNECDRSGFLGIGSPPPICDSLRAQSSQLTAQIRQIEAGSLSARRSQLMAALGEYGCFPRQQQAQQPMLPPANVQPRGGALYNTPPAAPAGNYQQEQIGLFDRLFGSRVNENQDMGIRQDTSPRIDGSPLNPQDPLVPQQERYGGRMAVCVRLCDGFFFPINFEGVNGRAEYTDVCNSLCPAAETRVFFMNPGADIDRAASREGAPYSSLENAKKYQTRYDPACFCKNQNQTWASVMRGAEDIVEARKGDIVVTPEQAAAMAKRFPETKGGAGKIDATQKEKNSANNLGHFGKNLTPDNDPNRGDTARKIRDVAPGLGGAKETLPAANNSGKKTLPQ